MSNEVSNIQLIAKPSISKTLRKMKVGESYRVKSTQMKPDIVRSAATRLKKAGLLFKVSGAGMVDEVIVTRLK